MNALPPAIPIRGLGCLIMLAETQAAAAEDRIAELDPVSPADRDAVKHGTQVVRDLRAAVAEVQAFLEAYQQWWKLTCVGQAAEGQVNGRG